MQTKIKFLLFIILAAAGITPSAALTVESGAGTLSAAVGNPAVVTSLTVKGELDITDFEYITTEMTALETLDMGDARIAAYSGNATMTGRTASPADVLPEGALMHPTLKHVVLPQGVTEIGAGALGSSGIEAITIPSTVKTIGDAAFGGCEALKAVTLPAGVTAIGVNLFKGCAALETAVIEAEISELPANTFLGCTSLKAVTLPATLTEIGSSAFAGCISLTKCDFPASLKSIGDRAFYATALQSLRLTGTSVESIGAWAFADCKGLAAVEFDAGIKSIGAGAFYDDMSLVLHEFPAGVKKISDFSLRGIEGAQEKLLGGARIDSIGAYALANWTGIQTFELPAGLKYIGDGGMAHWSAIRTISASSLTEVPRLGVDVWKGVSQSAVSLMVSEELETAFKNADQWREFNVRTGQTDIGSIELTPQPEEGIKVRFEGMSLVIEAPVDIAEVTLYDMSGRSDAMPVMKDTCRATVDTSAWNAPVMIVRIVLTDGSGSALKLHRE